MADDKYRQASIPDDTQLDLETGKSYHTSGPEAGQELGHGQDDSDAGGVWSGSALDADDEPSS
jgi:hypothetical protein